MKKNELLHLRELLKDEKANRKKIHDLLQDSSVKEYLSLTETPPKEKEYQDESLILQDLLAHLKFTSTNHILVCTRAFNIGCSICYEDTDYYIDDEPIDSKYADFRYYHDIESGLILKGTCDAREGTPLFSDIEKDNIVLNPTNSYANLNGYFGVKHDFFYNCVHYGQAKSKRLLLSKYQQLHL